MMSLSLGPNLWALGDDGLESLNVFSKVLHHVEKDYVQSIDEKKLIRGAIRGMLSTLDPHTVFMSPEVYKELKVDTSGLFGGIGIEIMIRDGWVTVVSPIEESPAFKVGIQPGDKIVKIDGVSTKDMDLSDAVVKMRGRRGSKVTLGILRLGQKNSFDVTVTREMVRVPSVKSESLDGKYGYVKINSFQEGTTRDLKKTLKKLSKEGSLHGLILDLRNNPGGLLEQAVEVSDLFLENGVIVTTASRDREVDRREAKQEGTEPNYPVIVLVNGGSASASEIVAGALKDHKRAVVLGTRTFGKGSVQTVVELDDGSALKLTIAMYYTPSGRSIQAEGIYPDIAVEATPPQEEEARPRIREEDLRGHLKSPTSGPPLTKLGETTIDNQKKVALDYLKSWDVFKSNGSNTLH